MKLSYRFSLIAFFTLIMIMVGYMLSISQIRLKVQRASEEHLAVNKRATDAAIESLSQVHRLFVRDYSYWDDMAKAVQAQDKDWISQEFFGPLEIYHADAAWVIDSSGALLFENSGPTSLPLPLSADELKVKSSPTDLSTFYKLVNGQLVAYHIGPILYHTQSELNTKPFGYVIVAATWNQAVLSQLSELLQADVTVLSPEQGANNLTDSQYLVYPFTSAAGQPTANMLIQFRDRAVPLLASLFEQEAARTATLGLVGVIGGLLIFRLVIIKPTHQLIKKLELLSKNSGKKLITAGGSEFSTLSTLIDQYAAQSDRLLDKNAQLRSADHELQELVDELKLSESATRKHLRESLKLAQAVESAADAIIITDKTGVVQYVNPGWQKLNGYASSEVVGKKPSVLKSNRTNRTIYKHLWEHLDKGLPYSSDDVINRRKDGSLYAARISVFPVKENNKVVNYVGIAQDISIQKEREHLKSEFISLASHQLRTPLTSLRWLSELLRKQTTKLLPPEVRDMVKDIELSSVRMIALVNRLLNLSRIETGRLNIHPSHVSLRQLTRQLKSDFEPHFKRKQQRFMVKIQTTASQIYTDHDLLREVLTNLLSNANKYTPVKGTIALRFESKRDYILCTVKDSGVGVPAAEQAHLFERFFRASNALEIDQQGTGLGLYLIKLIVEALGGEISLSSQEGQGTEVCFTLPKKGTRQAGEVGIIASKMN